MNKPVKLKDKMNGEVFTCKELTFQVYQPFEKLPGDSCDDCCLLLHSHCNYFHCNEKGANVLRFFEVEERAIGEVFTECDVVLQTVEDVTNKDSMLRCITSCYFNPKRCGGHENRLCGSSRRSDNKTVYFQLKSKVNMKQTKLRRKVTLGAVLLILPEECKEMVLNDFGYDYKLGDEIPDEVVLEYAKKHKGIDWLKENGFIKTKLTGILRIDTKNGPENYKFCKIGEDIYTLVSIETNMSLFHRFIHIANITDIKDSQIRNLTNGYNYEIIQPIGITIL